MRASRLLFVIALICGITAPLGLTPSAKAISENVVDAGWLVKPSTGGYAIETYCPSNMAVVGITIATSVALSHPYLQDFRILCNDGPVPEKGSNFSPVSRTFVSQPPGNATVRQEFCPSGSVIIGLRMATKEYVRDIAPVCLYRDRRVNS
jgi:hypothetical protein